MTFDPTVAYSGPQADFATLTGSPLWGVSIDEVIQAAYRFARWKFCSFINFPTVIIQLPLCVL